MNDVIPLDSRRSLKKVKNDPAHQAAKQRPAPVVAAEARYSRKCLVCQRPTGSQEVRYCDRHRGAFWRWLQCIEPGCETVGERITPGQSIYRCPEHRHIRHTQSDALPAESSEDTPGRERVRALLAARKQALAQEKRPLPPRPPYNIGPPGPVPFPG